MNCVMSRKVRRYLQKNVQIIQSKPPEAATGEDETGRESWDVCTVDVGLECDVSEVFLFLGFVFWPSSEVSNQGNHMTSETDGIF